MNSFKILSFLEENQNCDRFDLWFHMVFGTRIQVIKISTFPIGKVAISTSRNRVQQTMVFVRWTGFFGHENHNCDRFDLWFHMGFGARIPVFKIPTFPIGKVGILITVNRAPKTI